MIRIVILVVVYTILERYVDSTRSCSIYYIREICRSDPKLQSQQKISIYWKLGSRSPQAWSNKISFL